MHTHCTLSHMQLCMPLNAQGGDGEYSSDLALHHIPFKGGPEQRETRKTDRKQRQAEQNRSSGQDRGAAGQAKQTRPEQGATAEANKKTQTQQERQTGRKAGREGRQRDQDRQTRQDPLRDTFAGHLACTLTVPYPACTLVPVHSPIRPGGGRGTQ